MSLHFSTKIIELDREHTRVARKINLFDVSIPVKSSPKISTVQTYPLPSPSFRISQVHFPETGNATTRQSPILTSLKFGKCFDC